MFGKIPIPILALIYLDIDRMLSKDDEKGMCSVSAYSLRLCFFCACDYYMRMCESLSLSL